MQVLERDALDQIGEGPRRRLAHVDDPTIDGHLDGSSVFEGDPLRCLAGEPFL